MRSIADKLLEQGEEKERDKTALNMIKEGMEESTIRRITGLSIKRIKELKSGK